jgi:hypothetical protein
MRQKKYGETSNRIHRTQHEQRAGGTEPEHGIVACHHHKCLNIYDERQNYLNTSQFKILNHADFNVNSSHNLRSR